MPVIKKKVNYFVPIHSSTISERAFLYGRFHASPVCPSDKGNAQTKMSVKFWRNDTDREKPKHSEKNLSQWHFLTESVI